jgi:sterol-4alpha-carboxylate 3-dehydrogenase (decarboxylating)
MSNTPPSKSLGTVLVFGGCGFLGGHVVDQLLNFPSEDNSPDLSFSADAPKPIHSTTSLPDPTTLTFPSLRSRYPSYTNTTVHVVDLKCTRNTFPGATYHEADITSPSALLDIFRTVKPTCIINTVSPHVFSPKALLKKVNIDGTRTLLEVAAGIHGSWDGTCKAFVHTSSASVIHDSVSNLINANEDYPLVIPNPIEYYSETKARAEALVLSANRSAEYNNTLLTTAIRPAGIVGERDYGGFTNGVITTASIAPNWQLHFQLGEGNNLFDNTYVGNVVYAHLLAAEALIHTYDRGANAMPLNHEKIDGEAFIVTNDSPAYFWDTCRYLWTRYGRTVDADKVWVLPQGFASFAGGAAELTSWLTGRKGKLTRESVKYACMDRWYSCEKLKRRLGYVPLVGMEEALSRSVRSFAVEEREVKKEGKEKKVQ